MNPMNFLLGVMGSGSLTFVGLSAYAVMEARRMPPKQPQAEAVKPVEAPIEAIAAAPEAPAVQVAAESVPIVAEVPILAPATPALVLGYWPIRGLAGPLRMILAYGGVEYEDRRYDMAGWVGQEKPGLLKTNPMANLPYIKEGDSFIVQSNACLLYLGSKLGLDPTNILDPRAITNLQVLNESTDLRYSLAYLSYASLKVARTQEEFDASRTAQLTQKVPQVYTKLEAHLGQRNTAFFSADTPLSADFHVWEALDLHEILARSAGAESPLAQYPRLQSFYSTFRKLPQLEKYFASDACRLPTNYAPASPWYE